MISLRSLIQKPLVSSKSCEKISFSSFFRLMLGLQTFIFVAQRRLVATGLLFIMALSWGCSFKSPGKKKKTISRLNAEGTVVTNPANDSDGDKITDGVEIERGTDPFVADLPKLQVRFFQNYEIGYSSFTSSEDEDGSSSSASSRGFISSHTNGNSPDFRYRVGDVMLRDLSFASAASIGRFESHSWGVVNRQDLSWVKFPQVDPATYHVGALELRHHFKAGTVIDEATVKFENTVKLLSNSTYKEIRNLKLAFRYYDYENESYALLHEQVIERTFTAGTAESIKIELDNVPRKLIEDNYLRKGEFILSEVVDYEIPELNTTYQTLMNSVKAKSLPVLVTTPLETSTYWVGLPGGTASFQQILARIYDSNFTIEENALKKIDQFENNLPSYTYLTEVKDKDKKGKWFVFTERLQRHYLEHRYTTRDVISLSYVTGKDLASQVDEKIYNYLEKATGNDDFVTYPLGNVSPNSEISIQIEAGLQWGDKLTSFTEEFHSSRGSGGGGLSNDTHCFWEVNKFEERFDPFKLNKDFTGELSQLSLVINTGEFPLKKLVEDQLVTATWIDNSLNISTRNVSAIKEISSAEENTIGLKVATYTGETFNGIKLVNMTGRQYYYCPRHTLAFAYQSGLPVSNESFKFTEWRVQGRWDVLTVGERKTYKQPFSLQVSSSISNFHN